MLNLNLIQYQYLKGRKRTNLRNSDVGFSLIEVLVVALIIGILAAIAAPSWEAFTTRQKLRTVNNQVFQALKTVQAEAKAKKQSRKIEFENNDEGIPIIKISDKNNDPLEEKSLNLDGQVKANVIEVKAQVRGDAGKTAITFNHLGAITDEPDIPEDYDPGDEDYVSEEDSNFIVTVYLKDNSNAKRCVIVDTLVGGMTIPENTAKCGN